jgi:hypothetical protein
LIQMGELDLRSIFACVRVISLECRRDRLESFYAGLAKVEWPFHRPEVFRAVDGMKLPQPTQWKDGAGAWGCMQSHRQVLERAIMDDAGTLLVLEDDAICRRDFTAEVRQFLAKVPRDWDGLMLGGQAMEVRQVGPGVLRCMSCHRTHAYAVRGPYMRALYQHWISTVGHCDHRMGEIQRQFNVYAPDPFLIGQAQGESNIAGTADPARFWIPPSTDAPVILLRVPARLLPPLRIRGLHTGFNRDSASGIDSGLQAIFKGPRGQWVSRLRSWIEMIQWEIASMEDPKLCAVWHPEATENLIRSATSAPVFEVRANTLADVAKQLPTTAKLLGRARRRHSVVLIDCPAPVVAQLRAVGFHTGYWRDSTTDIDNGLASVLDGPIDNVRLQIRRMRHWFKELGNEAAAINGVVAVWHPKDRSEVRKAALLSRHCLD